MSRTSLWRLPTAATRSSVIVAKLLPSRCRCRLDTQEKLSLGGRIAYAARIMAVDFDGVPALSLSVA